MYFSIDNVYFTFSLCDIMSVGDYESHEYFSIDNV